MRCWWGCLALSVLSAGAASAGETPPSKVKLPLCAVDAGREVTSEELDAVAAELGAPLVRGAALAERIGLAAEASRVRVERLAESFAAAEDLFYGGDHAAAREELTALVEEVEEDPALFDRRPRLREAAFRARVHLADIARIEGRDERKDELILQAARRYPDLDPDPAQFPPWVREEHARVTSQSGWRDDGELIIDASAECELVVDGRRVEGRDNRFRHLSFGPHAVRAVCFGRTGPLLEVQLGAGPVELSPPLTEATELSFEGGAVRLVAGEETAGEEIAVALAELARAADSPRAVALVGSPWSVEVWLVDAEADSAVRMGAEKGIGAEPASAAAAELIEPQPPAESDGEGGEPEPWYRDGAAWTLAGIGIAAIGTGVAVRGIHGSPSRWEPAAWMLVGAGAGVAGTGVTLFFVGHDGEGHPTAAGLAVSGRF
ncbi:MAG: hypothetical protein R6V85_14795 [Polyangia bacterium]